MATDPNEFTIDAMLADSAVTADGKLFVQGGGWNLIGTPSFPFQVPRIGIALVIGIPYAETNRNHTLEIQFAGEDGPIPLGHTTDPDSGDTKPLMGVGSQFNVGRPPSIQPGDRQVIPMAMNFNSVQFDKPGMHSFSILIDGTEVNRLEFRVTG